LYKRNYCEVEEKLNVYNESSKKIISCSTSDQIMWEDISLKVELSTL
jgi:hypothetical protein